MSPAVACERDEIVLALIDLDRSAGTYHKAMVPLMEAPCGRTYLQVFDALTKLRTRARHAGCHDLDILAQAMFARANAKDHAHWQLWSVVVQAIWQAVAKGAA